MEAVKSWFDLHLSDEKARTLNRQQYYEMRSWLRLVRRKMADRFAAAHIDPYDPRLLHIPAAPTYPNEARCP